MTDYDPVTHHQSNRRCADFEYGDLFSHNWERVDCEVCFERREKAKRGSVYVALGFGLLGFLLFVSCLAVAL